MGLRRRWRQQVKGERAKVSANRERLLSASEPAGERNQALMD
jgi:hypothetical protein